LSLGLCAVCGHELHPGSRCPVKSFSTFTCGCPGECAHGNSPAGCSYCEKLYRAKKKPPMGVQGMKAGIIPEDSIFVDWLKLLSLAETPVSYQVLTGLAAFGASLRRNVHVNQVNWKIFPNISILLVGPSGIGKDTAINEAEKFLKADVEIYKSSPTGKRDKFVFHPGLPKVYGRTIEAMFEQMLNLGDPACCYIPAPEITSFLGQKDYQSGIINELTDILSTKDSHDVTTKADLKSGNATRSIPHPTVCLFAGSTEEWLHKSMPDGSLEGGWWPRFVIACEEYGSKMVPLLGSLPKSEILEAKAAKLRFYERAHAIIAKYIGKNIEIDILNEAKDFYNNWYRNRHSYFSKTVRPYAERSRDQVIRLAMLMALSRGHGYIELLDMEFGAAMMAYVAARIDNAVKPPGRLSQIAKQAGVLMPCSHADIMAGLSRSTDPKLINDALAMMVERKEVLKDGEMYSKVEKV
jgi:hypothetical protein